MSEDHLAINSDLNEVVKEKFGLKRLLIISLLVVVNTSSAFIYDNPSALQDVMIESLPHCTYSTIASFYSWYSWPNVLLVLLLFNQSSDN